MSIWMRRYRDLAPSILSTAAPTFTSWDEGTSRVDLASRNPDQQIRITLDYALQFYDQTGKLQISTSFASKMHDFVVLEGKTPIGSESLLRRLLRPLARRSGRCSKYVHGCQLLGLVSDGV